MNNYVNTIYSDDFQKELKSIKKAEFNTKERVEKLALGLAFNTRRHSRYKESEADSMRSEEHTSELQSH